MIVRCCGWLLLLLLLLLAVGPFLLWIVNHCPALDLFLMKGTSTLLASTVGISGLCHPTSDQYAPVFPLCQCSGRHIHLENATTITTLSASHNIMEEPLQQPSEIPQQPLLLRRQRQLEENDDENANNANDDNTNTDDNDSSNNDMYSYQSNYWRRYDDQYFRDDDDTADATEDDDDDSMYGTRASNNQNQDHQQSSSSSSANTNSHHHFYHGFYVLHASLALVCVFVGAIASGLYIGLLSLDPLLLVIKSRNTSAPQAERDRANHLLVLVTQERHALIVTLLLINCLAAEAMPIFLQPMVQHSAVAIILSVLLVLVFGEILPSLLCTGVDQLVIASRLAPIVRGLMILMYPIVMPIAYLMEALSNYASSASPLSKSASGVSGASSSEDDPYSSNLSNGGGGGYGYACGGGHRPRIGYTRGELAVLIRVQHEERRALREQRRATMQQSSLSSLNEMDVSLSNSLTQTLTMTGSTSLRSLRGGGRGYHRQVSAASIDSVDVNIMEGALSLKTRTAMDVFLGYHKVFCVPNDMVLDESNIFTIYASGYSRVPVYEDNNRRRIKGILMTRQLMVVKRANQTFSRRNSTGSDKNASNKSLSMTPAPPQLSDLTLYTPKCVAPETTLAEMINMFQKPKAGHMALVCARPSVGKEALESGFALPERAGLMGIITLEDVLEALLQEQIYDEADRVDHSERFVKPLDGMPTIEEVHSYHLAV